MEVMHNSETLDSSGQTMHKHCTTSRGENASFRGESAVGGGGGNVKNERFEHQHERMLSNQKKKHV